MPKIIIIGAGIAGISCARYLADRTNFDVEIFEANEERYGGRLWSKEIPGYAGKYVELGGMWLHEGQDPCHPLRPIFQTLDVQENEAGDLNTVQCIRNDGRMLSPEDVARLGSLPKKLDDLRQKLIDENSGRDISLAQAIEQISTKDDERVLEIFTGSLESYHGSTKDKISLLYGDGIPNSPKSMNLTGNDLVVTNGYMKILDHMIRNGRKFDIKFGHIVETIDYTQNHDKKIQITCQCGEKFLADHVIVTVPLSILKRKMIKFVPELPEDQQIAIKRIGFDYKLKVFLLFDHVFWPEEKSAFFYESKNPSGFPIYVGNIFYVNRSPGLLAMVSGDAVHAAEEMSKREIVEKILQSLRKMFGEDKVNRAKIVYSEVVNWGEQEHIYGAYSFSQIGMKPEDAYNICKPISPLLYFAGEHTAFLEDLHGSATGAYVSGIRAAKELLSDNKHYFPARSFLKSKL